jgi:hypothetical protein
MFLVHLKPIDMIKVVLFHSLVQFKDDDSWRKCYVIGSLRHWMFCVQELGAYSLRGRGLCLVPVSCTAGVARSNGADIWAPTKTTSPKFEKPISQFH